jgi:CBS domain-containing protein
MRRVSDVMTSQVVTVSPSTPFKEVVEVLRTHRVTAAPVVDELGLVQGVVSEADLLLKQEYPRDHEPPLGERLRHRADQARSRGTIARDFMSSPAVTIGEDATVQEAERLLHARHLKRLPVVDDDGRLVGIVSRADLLGVFLRPDEDIRTEIVEDLIGRRMLMAPGRLTVAVDRGVVTLEGRCELRSLVSRLIRLVYAVDGVVHVDARLDWEVDDTRPRAVEFAQLGP